MGKDDIEDIEIKVHRDQESQGKFKRDSLAEVVNLCRGDRICGVAKTPICPPEFVVLLL